jgi:sugar phosphate permease
MIVAAIFTLVLAIIIWFFLVPEPESIGIYIEEMTDKEMLIASAVEKDVFENVIRNCISEP